MTMSREQRRANERAIRKAAARVAAAAADPASMARDNAEYQRQLQIADALLGALMRMLERPGGPSTVRVPRAEWQAPPPNQHLSITTDENENAILAIHRGKRVGCEKCEAGGSNP